VRQPNLFGGEPPGGRARVVLERDGVVTYDSRFLDEQSAADAFAALTAEIAWSQDSMVMYGRRVAFPRLTAWYGDPGAAYTYSGVRNEPRAWTPLLTGLRDRVAAAVGARFNSVLLNRYRGGADGMGWHADDERELGPEPVIASLSLGAVRTFELRHRTDRERIALPLASGSLLVMSGATQRHWLHRVPKDARAAGARINLTFRLVDAGPQPR
jgi:alkylated DNA repair dioxygenase AlkB